jgi:hypothetical protein
MAPVLILFLLYVAKHNFVTFRAREVKKIELNWI